MLGAGWGREWGVLAKQLQRYALTRVSGPICMSVSGFVRPHAHTHTARFLHTQRTISHTQGQYVSLGMMRTPRDWLVGAVVFTLLAALFGGNSAYKSVTGARAASRRKAALASLEKDE